MSVVIFGHEYVINKYSTVLNGVETNVNELFWLFIHLLGSLPPSSNPPKKKSRKNVIESHILQIAWLHTQIHKMRDKLAYTRTQCALTQTNKQISVDCARPCCWFKELLNIIWLGNVENCHKEMRRDKHPPPFLCSMFVRAK